MSLTELLAQRLQEMMEALPDEAPPEAVVERVLDVLENTGALPVGTKHQITVELQKRSEATLREFLS